MCSRLLTRIRCQCTLAASAMAMVVGLMCILTPEVSYGQLSIGRVIGSAVSDLDSNNYPEVGEAIKRFANSDVAGARSLLEAAGEKYPQLPPVDVSLAKMYILTQQSASARTALEGAVAKWPNDPEAYLLIADTQFRAGNFTAADVLYQKALELTKTYDGNPKRRRNFLVSSHAGLAAIAEGRAQWDQAVTHLRVFLEHSPDTARANERLGRALFHVGSKTEALSYLERARELDSTLLYPYVTLGNLFQGAGDTENARKAYSKAFQDDRNSLTTLLSYAQWLIRAGTPAAAEAPLASARRLQPDSQQALLLSGVLAKIAQKPAAAEDYLTQALQLSPTDEATLNELALLLIDRDDDVSKRRAFEYAQLNMAAHPTSTNAKVTNVWVLYQLGRNAQANEALQKARLSGRLSADAYFLLAKIFFDQSQMDKASTFVELSLQPSSNPGIFVHREEAEALREAIARTRQ